MPAVWPESADHCEADDKTIVDLVFTDNGCRKTVTKYVGARASCPQCAGRSWVPPAIGALPEFAFGRGLQAWAIYQRLVLRLPYRVITQALEDQFHVHVSESTIVASIRYFARDYAETEERLPPTTSAQPLHSRRRDQDQ